jgi:hypothetical protein
MPRGKKRPHDLFESLVLVPSSCFGLSWAKGKFGSNYEEYLLEGKVGVKKKVKNKELFQLYFSFDESTYEWNKEYILKFVVMDVSLLGEVAFLKGVVAPGLRYKVGTNLTSRGDMWSFFATMWN